jgi:hypothetical protein
MKRLISPFEIRSFQGAGYEDYFFWHVISRGIVEAYQNFGPKNSRHLQEQRVKPAGGKQSAGKN